MQELSTQTHKDINTYIKESMQRFKLHMFTEEPLTHEEEQEADILYGFSCMLRTGLFDCLGNVNTRLGLKKLKDSIRKYEYIMSKLIPFARHANFVELKLWALYNDLNKLIEYKDLKYDIH